MSTTGWVERDRRFLSCMASVEMDCALGRGSSRALLRGAHHRARSCVFRAESFQVSPSLDLQSTTFLALLRHLNIQQADVMGISYGGFVTMEMKRTGEANEVGRIIVIDSPGGHFDEEEEAAMLQRFGVSDPKDIFVPQDWRAVRRLIGLVFYRPPYMPSWVYRDVKTKSSIKTKIRTMSFSLS